MAWYMYPYTTENEENTIIKRKKSRFRQLPGRTPFIFRRALTKLKARVKRKHNIQGKVFKAQEYVVLQMEAPETHTVHPF